MDELEFRQVSVEDFDDVMEIRGNLYSGLDYLPALYRYLLQSYTGFAAYFQNKMIAFVLTKVIDDGATLLLRAGRVSPEEEGKGVYKRLTDFVEQHVCDKLKSCPIVRKTFVVPRDSIRDTLVAKGAKVTFQRKVIIAYGEKTDVEKRLGGQNIVTGICDEDRLLSMATSDKLRHHLFPDDRIVINSVPYRLTESNLKTIMVTNINILASNLDNQHTVPLLTCSSSYACAAGTRLNIDIFGCSESYSEIFEHIRRHLSINFEQEGKTTVNLFITHDFHFEAGLLSDVLKNLLFTLDTSRPVVSVGIEENIQGLK